MDDSRSPGGKKGGRVEVIYFPPKRGRSSAGEVRSPRITLPDLEVPPLEKARSSPKRKRGEKASRPSKRARETLLEPVRRKAKQLHEALSRPEGHKAPVSRTEIAEMSLFGHHLFERGQLDEARSVFEKIVAWGVKEAFPHTMLGTIYLAKGQKDRALTLFETALQLDGLDMAARVYRAEILLEGGKLEDAIQDLQRAIAQGRAGDPFVARAHKLLRMAEERARRTRR